MHDAVGLFTTKLMGGSSLMFDGTGEEDCQMACACTRRGVCLSVCLSANRAGRTDARSGWTDARSGRTDARASVRPALSYQVSAINFYLGRSLMS